METIELIIILGNTFIEQNNMLNPIMKNAEKAVLDAGTKQSDFKILIEITGVHFISNP